jgi:hypothetical protein
MSFTVEHEFAGSKYTVAGDASELRVTGPDGPDVLVHFVKIFNECSIELTALQRKRTSEGQVALVFEFVVEDEQDLQLLVEELSTTK